MDYENEAVKCKVTNTTLQIFSDVEQRKWLHNLRELFRAALARQVACRRPRDFGHCQDGIDRERSFTLWRKSRHHPTIMALKVWHTGSIPFKERQWRHHRGHNAPSPFCTWCWHHVGEKNLETVHHMVVDCPFAVHHRKSDIWNTLHKLKPQMIETGILDKNHALTENQAKQWKAFQQEVANIIHARNVQLSALEQQRGSPPSHPKPGAQPRYRLTYKQPPTATCPSSSPNSTTRSSKMTLLAEENPLGEWHFNNHYIVALPTGEHAQRQALFCVHCRRSASLVSNSTEQALRTIHKRNVRGCAPSSTRFKIDCSLHDHLPRDHLDVVAKGAKRLLVCERCGDSSPNANLGSPWALRHTLCHWLAKSVSASSGT